MKACKLHVLGIGVVLFASACTRSDPSGTATTATAVPSEAPTIAITGTPQPAPAASALPSAATTATAAASAAPSAPAAAATAKPAASSKTTALAASASAKPEPAAPLKPASTRLSGKNFTLDVASPGCKVDVPCAVSLRLTASDEFHVNKEYPYKFTAAPAPGVQFLGSGDANVFTRADLREEGEKTATMTVRFKPTAAGEAKVSGVYKLSVCSASQCQIETQAVALSVPVM